MFLGNVPTWRGSLTRQAIATATPADGAGSFAGVEPWPLRWFEVSRLSPGHNTAVIAAAAVVGAIVLALALVASGGALVTAAVHDAFIWFDVAHRIDASQVPHRDFHSPLGALALTLPYLGYRLSGNYAGAMPMVFALYLLAFAPIAIYVLASRLRAWVAVPVVLYLMLLIAAPIVPEVMPTKANLGLWYNRLGWATFTLLLFLYLPPVRDGSSRGRPYVLADSAVIAVLVLALFYLKISYAACAVAVLGLMALLDHGRRKAILYAVPLVLSVVAVIELIWHIHGAYFADLAFLFKSTVALRGGVLKFAATAIKVIEPLSLVAFAMILLAALGLLRWRDVLFVGFIAGCGLALMNQNTGDNAMPLLIMPAAMVACRLTASLPENPGEAGWMRLAVGMALILILTVQPIAWRSIAVARQAMAARWMDGDALPVAVPGIEGLVVRDSFGMKLRASDPNVLARLQDPSLTASEAFVLLRDRQELDAQELLSNAEYLFTLARGVEALESIGYQARTVFTFDTVNPFNFLLGLPPVQGELFNYDLGRQYTLENYVPAEEFFGSVSIAMVPKYPMTPINREALMKLYGPYLEAHFAVAADTPFWTAWLRKREPKP